ncbi:MAG: hypothetical protein GX796_09705 [Clostridiaceae bacterium]|jgi:hypothetical protein|nr:hypothetical protein [Clostridiaceae bacterium]
MKILMKSVDMICLNSFDGAITPIKFRWCEDGQEPKIIRIDRILDQKTEKLAGNLMLVFTVQSIINNVERIFEMKYEVKSYKWYLYKL